MVYVFEVKSFFFFIVYYVLSLNHKGNSLKQFKFTNDFFMFALLPEFFSEDTLCTSFIH